MPLYEYECKQCHQRLEKIQTFSAPPEKICPKCGGELERVISAPAFQFKGAGWYVNDYAKSSGTTKTTDGSAQKTASPSDGKSDSAGDSKTASVPSGEPSSSSTGSASAAPSSNTGSDSATKNDSTK